ncbi:unnamed protein product [Lactuca virosa]|uniref:Transmembrane protein n=1 Tax=Lactuca virosa TaxID=75947 RepID=A0AAU9M5A3_9ASTR|nr:unnamed protein product [Lactuca virosa]
MIIDLLTRSLRPQLPFLSSSIILFLLSDFQLAALLLHYSFFRFSLLPLSSFFTLPFFLSLPFFRFSLLPLSFFFALRCSFVAAFLFSLPPPVSFVESPNSTEEKRKLLKQYEHPPNSSTVPTCITADIVATPAAALSLPLCLNKSSGVEGKDCEESSLRRRRG